MTAATENVNHFSMDGIFARDQVTHKLFESGSFDEAVKDIVNGKADPYTASAALVQSMLNGSADQIREE